MEEKIYKASVERLNRLQMVLVLWGIIFAAFGTSSFLYECFGLEIRGEVIFLAIIIVMCVFIEKLEKAFPSVEEVEAVFGAEEVKFKKGRNVRVISYTDIREVEKMMIINRFHSEKGYYRVKIKTMGRSYALYSGEDSNKKLDFDDTGLSKIYFELMKRGVKCC